MKCLEEDLVQGGFVFVEERGREVEEGARVLMTFDDGVIIAVE